MKKHIAVCILLILVLALHTPSAVGREAAINRAQLAPPAPKVCERCIRSHEEFLASDAMQGRGSGTHDELVAATYIASELRRYGIEPGGDNGSYIQVVPTIQWKMTSPPQLRITPSDSRAEAITWDYGKEFLVSDLKRTIFSGPLRKIDADEIRDGKNQKIEKGAVVLITGSDQAKAKDFAFSPASQGLAATLMLASDTKLKNFEGAGEHLPNLSARLQDDSENDVDANVLELNRGAFRALERMPEGTMVHFEARTSDQKCSTWNVVGIIHGSDPLLQHAAIL